MGFLGHMVYTVSVSALQSNCITMYECLSFSDFFSHSNKPLIVFHSDFNFNFLNGQGW